MMKSSSKMVISLEREINILKSIKHVSFFFFFFFFFFLNIHYNVINYLKILQFLLIIIYIYIYFN